MKHHLETLGLQEGATQQEIQEAYDRLSKELNPANNNNQEFFKEEYEKVKEAHKALYNTSILATTEGASGSNLEGFNLKLNQKTDVLEKLKSYKKIIIISISTIILIGLIANTFIVPFINKTINYNKGVSIMKIANTHNEFMEATSYFEKVMEVSENFKDVDSLHLKSIYEGLVLYNKKDTEESLLTGSQVDLYINSFFDTISFFPIRKLKIFYILNKDTIPNYIKKKELYIGLLRAGTGSIPFSSSDTISIKTELSGLDNVSNSFYSKKFNLNKPKISEIIVGDAFEILGALDSINLDYLWFKTGKGKIAIGESQMPQYYEKIIKYYPTNQTEETHYDQHQKLFKLYEVVPSEIEDRIMNKMRLINNARLKKDPWVNLALANRNLGLFECYKCTTLKLKSTLTLLDKVISNRLSEGFNAKFKDSIRIAQTYKMKAAVHRNLKSYTKAIIDYTKALNYYPSDFSSENTSGIIYDPPRDMNIHELTDLYYDRAMVKFDKTDWLGAMSDFKKALSYYNNDYKDVPNYWRIIRPESILRNLFSSKWNYGENGDKRGACEDLKIAADLDPEEYYDYYIKNCSK